jgi:3-dehydroquinate synthase
MSSRQELKVPFSYDVVFTRHVFGPDNDSLAGVLEGSPARVVFFLDAGLVDCRPGLPAEIRDWCQRRPESVELAAPVQVVPGGEAIKNDLRILDRVGSLARETGLCRHSYIVIVGGGAVLDAVGFAAALIHRGIRQVRIPTTVLSQGDSGVGVKNGVNRFGQKNFYGTFSPPRAVINDAELLTTLEDRDWTSGISEAFKVALIKDREFLELLSESAEKLSERDLDAMEQVTNRAALLHLDHIAKGGDAFETGSARPLDFGHWAAHRLETMTDHKLRHGEAVAIGIALDLFAAVEMGRITTEDWVFVLDAMERCGLVLWHDALERRDRNHRLEVLAGLSQFREHLGGELTLAMPDGLGRTTDIHELDEELVERAVKALSRRAGRSSGEAHISRIA